MGAEPWSYFVPYQASVQAAMEALQEQEFAAGRYHSRRSYEPSLPAPSSIDDVRQNYLTAEGSRSILDMIEVVDDASESSMHEQIPEELRGMMGGGLGVFCTIVRLPDDDMHRLLGTTRPTRAMIESNRGYYELIDRGCGIYIVAYRDGQPDEIFFAGYSFD